MTESEKIAQLNDELRASIGKPVDQVPGKIMMTHGISILDPGDQGAIFARVRDFNVFTEANDPYKEHDFGTFDYDGYTVNWRISYYDKEAFEKGQECGSEHPEDPDKTLRILTIMFASEN